MIPAEKYMNIRGKKENNLSRSSDMKFIPFKSDSDKNTSADNLKDNLIGWTPVYLYPHIKNMPDTITSLLKMNSSNNNTVIGWTPVYLYPHIKNISTNMNNISNMMNMPNINPYNSTSKNDKYTPDEYPSETSEDILYSYNNKSNSKREISKTSTQNTKNYNKVFQFLKEFNIDLDENTNFTRNSNEDIEKIYKEFENENPGTFSLLKTYNVPYPIVKMIFKRVIKMSLKNCNKEGE